MCCLCVVFVCYVYCFVVLFYVFVSCCCFMNLFVVFNCFVCYLFCLLFVLFVCFVFFYPGWRGALTPGDGELGRPKT